MCVTSAKALLTSTYVGAWEIEHPTYGYRHVLAYQNAPQNLADGPNCMLLHVPAAAPILPEHLLDTADCPDLLRQMSRQLLANYSRSNIVPQQIFVVEMGVYHVVLLNEKSEAGLNAALEQIPLEKRPNIAPELLNFYATQFPDYPLVLACFNNRDSHNASPIMLHYQPIHAEYLFYNLLEGHDGGAPVLEQTIQRHQTIIAGSNRLDAWKEEPKKFNYPGVPEHLLPFLPTLGATQELVGDAPNGDGWYRLT